MKRYYVDTNIFLRFLLKDIPKQTKAVRKMILEARKGLIELVVIPEILIEMEYVLRKVYAIPKSQIVPILQSITTMPEVKIDRREEIIDAILVFEKYNVDLSDSFLYTCARHNHGEVFSFDRDFKKIISA